MATANLNQPTSAANGNIPYIGATANDDSGNTIRDSFSRLNDRIKEIYGAQDGSNVVQTPFVDGDNIKDDTITESHLDVTNSPVDGYVLTYDSASSGFTWEQKFDGDITGIVAGDGLTGSSLDSGNATLNVNVDDSTIEIDTDTVRVKALGIDTGQLAADAVDGTKIADDAIDSEHYTDGSIDTAHIADDQITHAKLEDRYTAVQDISTTSGTINLDASSYAAFNLTGNLTTATLNVQNIKTGQAIDILLSGTLTSAVLTLADDFTTSSINKVGSNDLDTTGTNLIQLLCVDDTDSDAILTWAVATYTTDTSA